MTSTTKTLVQALDPKGNKALGTILDHFLNRSGYPLIRFKTQWQSGDAPQVLIEQVPPPLQQLGHEIAKMDSAYLLSIRHDDLVHRHCSLMTTKRETQALKVSSCPDWLHGNADNLGYYQWYSDGPELTSLVTKHSGRLTAEERAALPESLLSLVELGAISLWDYIDGLTALSQLTERFVLEGVINGLNQLSRLNRTDDQRQEFAVLVRAVLTPHFKRLGTEKRADEPAQDTLLRPQILFPLAFLGDDESLQRWAREKTQKFLANEKSVTSEDLNMVLPIAARRGDEALWTALTQRLRGTTNPIEALLSWVPWVHLKIHGYSLKPLSSF